MKQEINFKQWVEMHDPETKWDWDNPEKICKQLNDNIKECGHLDIWTVFKNMFLNNDPGISPEQVAKFEKYTEEYESRRAKFFEKQNMNNEKLDALVKEGSIQNYTYVNLDENGERGKSEGRSTQELTLFFQNGRTLKINCFCSGSFQNTILDFHD